MDTLNVVLLVALVAAVVIPAWVLLILQSYSASKRTPQLPIEVTETSERLSSKYRKALKSTLTTYFSMTELKDMCFYLDIQWDDLEGTTRNEKIIALSEYIIRHNKIDVTNNYLRMNRRDI